MDRYIPAEDTNAFAPPNEIDLQRLKKIVHGVEDVAVDYAGVAEEIDRRPRRRGFAGTPGRHDRFIGLTAI
jgi:hypothetical protein